MIKDKIVSILRERPGGFVSGQLISEQLGVTRAAVWKAVRQLENEGYGIESLPHQGYKLTTQANTMTEAELKYRLHTGVLGKKIVHFQSIDSTNRKAKELAEQGEPEGTVVVAESQTGGRGCAGRPWASGPMLGIWMSVILHPMLDLPSVPRLTQMACAAVGRALEQKKIAGPVQIRWPNDILLGGKKIGGVLTETSGEIDLVQYAVVGIGVNVNQESGDFPSALSDKATSLKLETGQTQSRQELFCAILEAFEQFYLEGEKEDAVAYCKRHSATLGQCMALMENGEEATAIDIDKQGALVLRMPNGEVRHISSGSGLKR